MPDATGLVVATVLLCCYIAFSWGRRGHVSFQQCVPYLCLPLRALTLPSILYLWLSPSLLSSTWGELRGWWWDAPEHRVYFLIETLYFLLCTYKRASVFLGSVGFFLLTYLPSTSFMPVCLLNARCVMAAALSAPSLCQVLF